MPKTPSLLAALLLAACSSAPKITTDYDHENDFSHYRTFGFFEPLGTDAAGYESLVSQTLKDAARAELEARGYVYSESMPDLQVNFNALIQEKTRVTSAPAPITSTYYGYRGRRYQPWDTYAMETTVDSYEWGTLNVDLVDAAKGKLVWEGVARGRVTQKTWEQRQAVLRQVVHDVFADYPFRAGGGTAR